MTDPATTRRPARLSPSRKRQQPRLIRLPARPKADAAASIGPEPAPAKIKAELISGGNTE
ncbi:hypothetical protein IU15_07670 [Mycobacterium tuberculosis]|nr:hypothetical protein IU15_07670 [Mycobacterium tuberculosis]